MIFHFTRSARLLHKNQYDYVFQLAKKIGTHFFVILYRENTLGYPRLGLIVAKKTAKRSHERNRFKRIARESFRLMQPKLPNVDVIVLSRNGFEKTTNQQLFNEFAFGWKKILRDY